MDTIEERVRAEAATELERLGSDRGLIALTDADLSSETIRERLAGVLAGTADVYEEWANDDAFTTATETTRTLTATTSDTDIEPASDHPLVTALDGLEDHPERVGAGLIAVPLVLDGWVLQGVSFFVNEADESVADQFRAIRTGLDEVMATGESAVGSEAERERATEAALALVEAAYEDYVETLDGLGLDPKTVC
jgi:5S rRNA maturation endonuclease (ribonuclease M5)